MSFALFRKVNFYGSVLGEGASFAEWVTLRETGKPERSIRASIEIAAAEQDDAHATRETETATVHVGNDEAHELGGIRSPRIGMTIWLENDEVPFAFTGDVVKRTSHSWSLVFTRPLITRVGKR